MTKNEYAQYIASPEWKEKRKEALLSSGNICQLCEIPRWLASIVYDQDLHVHHLHYKNVGNENPEALQVLCRRCHEIETFGRSSLKEPKSSECEICKDKHWDPYSDTCSVCRAMFAPGFPLTFIYAGWNSTIEDEAWVPYLEDMFQSIRHGLISLPKALAIISKALAEPYDKTGLYGPKN